MDMLTKKQAEPLCVAEMKLAQIRSDGSAVYRVADAGGAPFEMGDIVAKSGFLPNDTDFNLSFINAETDDKATKKKQREFAKFLKLKVKIEL